MGGALFLATAAHAQPTFSDCTSISNPLGGTAPCKDICYDLGSPYDTVRCDFQENSYCDDDPGGDNAHAEVKLVRNDDTGAQDWVMLGVCVDSGGTPIETFCCIIEDVDDEVHNFDLRGTDNRDTLWLYYDTNGGSPGGVERMDVLTGYSGTTFDVTVEGEGGDDWVIGSTSTNAKYNEYLRGGAGNDHIQGQAGDDWLQGNGGDDRMEGGPDIDRIDGNSGEDIIIGNSGGDEIYGHDGIDRICGDDGSFGNTGDVDDPGSWTLDECLNTGIGVDVIYGGAETDFIHGGPSNDFIYGEDGADRLVGGADDDTVVGHTGNDIICDDDGADKLYGSNIPDSVSNGNDTIVDTDFAATSAHLIDGGDDGADVCYPDDASYPSHIQECESVGTSTCPFDMSNGE